ncbi:hypothetical protein M758_12G101100 [Ceratodon purpureus]|nr:hypothetical protein M758_12G101100 [Ceratodon purpureus]
MAQVNRDGTRQILLNQTQNWTHMKGLNYFGSYNLLLSLFISIKCSQILITGRNSLGGTIADLFIIVLTLLGAQGNLRRPIKSVCHPGRHAILLVTFSTSLLSTGAHAERQSNEVSIQSCICAVPNPHAWEIHDHALTAAAVTILAAVMVIGVAVARRIINCQQQFPENQADVPEIPAPVPALPIIPEVQGDDIDDVLARAPIPSRLNSPLSWL